MMSWTIGLEQSSSMSYVSTVQDTLRHGLFKSEFPEFTNSNKHINPIPPNPTHIHLREEGEIASNPSQCDHSIG